MYLAYTCGIKLFTQLFTHTLLCLLTLAIDCGPPPHGGNLLVHYTGTTYQSVVSYHCRTCYQLVNRDTSVNRTCGSNGRWNGSFPVCKCKRYISRQAYMYMHNIAILRVLLCGHYNSCFFMRLLLLCELELLCVFVYNTAILHIHVLLCVNVMCV